VRKLIVTSSLLIILGTSTALSEPVSLPELKKAVAFILIDLEKLKAENQKIEKELRKLKEENNVLKQKLNSIYKDKTPEFPELFSELVLSPYILYVGTYRSFRGAVLKASQVLNEGETPLVISLRGKDLFAVAIECSSSEECQAKKRRFNGFVSFRKERGKSAVFNMKELFNEAKTKLKGRTSVLIKGIQFYRIKTDPRMVRPYPHIRDGNSFIVMKLEGTL